MKSYVERDTFTCRNYNHHRKGIYEISMPYDDCIPYFINSGGLYTIGKVKAYLDGYLKKDCQLCKWQAEDMSGSKFCKLYKNVVIQNIAMIMMFQNVQCLERIH